MCILHIKPNKVYVLFILNNMYYTLTYYIIFIYYTLFIYIIDIDISLQIIIFYKRITN